MFEKIKNYQYLFFKILKFEIFYKIGIILIISPFFNKIIQMYLNDRSLGGAFNQYIVFDFLTIEGILIILLVMLGAIMTIIYEYSVIINMITLKSQGIDFRIYDVLKTSILNLKCLKYPSTLLAGLYFILLLPLVHLGYINSLFPSFKIPNFIFGELKLTLVGNILIVLIYLLYYGIYLLLFFVPVMMVLKKESFIKAFKDNLKIHRSLQLKQRITLIALIVGWIIMEMLLKQQLPNALIKNADFNRYFLKNLITSSLFRNYLIQYLIYSLIIVALIVIFYQIVLKIVSKQDEEIVKVAIDTDFNQAFDETVLEAKIQGNIIYQFLDKNIFKNEFYQKHWGIINLIFWAALVLIITYISPNSIYILCTILIVVIVMYFVASIINRYEQKNNKTKASKSNSILFWPYQVIRNVLNRSKIYNKHPKIVTFTLVSLAVLLVGAYLEPSTMVHHPWVIGHRGSHYGVENTYSAVKGASDHNANYAEIDVQLSSDGIPVVIHDNDLSRLANERKKVSNSTAKELTKLTVYQGNYQDKIPTLDGLIKKMKKNDIDVDLLIELKTENSDSQKLAKEIIKVVEKNNFEDRSIFMSLDYDAVTYLQQEHPEWWIGYCIYGSAGDLDESLWNMDIDFLAIEENRATLSFIEKANNNWVPVYVWTVDTSDKMRQYLDMGVSGIITNYPDRGKAAVDDYLKHNYQYYYYKGNSYPAF